MPHYIANDGAELYYDRSGSGPPVIFVHGFAAAPRIFDRQAAILAERYTIIRPHLRGHGLSAGIHHGGRMARLARDLHDLIEAEGISAVRFVGWSMGCAAVWSYLDVFGERAVAGYAFIDEIPYVLEALDTVGTPVTKIEGGPLVGLHGKFADPATRREAVQGFISSMLRTAGEADRAAILKDAETGATDVSVSLLLDSNSTDFRDIIPRLGKPALFISGAESFFKPRFFEWMHKVAQDSRLEIIPDAGHFLLVEQADALNRHLLQFLAEIEINSQSESRRHDRRQ